jgi:hypothetical protein
MMPCAREYNTGMQTGWIKAVGIVIITAFIGLVVRFLIGGNEDSWVCVNGSWARHGNPSGTPPLTPCGYTP